MARSSFPTHRASRRGVRAAAATLALTVGLGATALPAQADNPKLPPNAVEIAKATPDLSILVQAVVKAGLADTLAADGDLTIFAPTNTAFGDLLKKLGVSSLDDIPVETLRAVLLDHVIVKGPQIWAGGLVQADWLDTPIVTAGGLVLDADRAPLGVNDAKVIAGDIWARNGVIHVIDTVLLDPDPRPTIAGIAASNPDFSILLAAVQKAGLASTLAGKGNFTVFAPTNKAFADLLKKLGASSLDDIPVATLRAVLLDHVVAGELDAVDVAGRIPNHQGADALGGLWLQFTAGPLQVNGANIVAVDVEASNGTVHVIDEVLLRG
jgi:transforming growth factor-beta-induced protein